jgi:hypothetical protein
MMSGWQILHTYNGIDRDITGCWRNVTGSPVRSAAKVAPGAPGFASPIAAVYRFTLVSPAAVSCRGISNEDSLNPLIFSGTRSVIADGATVNLHLLPGWGIVLASDAQAGDVFEIGVGCCLDEDFMSWQRILSFGPRMTGYTSAARTVTAKNISGGTLTNCIAAITNAVRVGNDQGPARPFHAFYQQGMLNPTADQDQDGVPVTFANYVPGSPCTVSMLIDGNGEDIYDVAADRVLPRGIGLKCDGATLYAFLHGSKYQSARFILAADLAEPDSATLFVSDGGESVWVSSGSGTPVAGPSGLTLTETGKSYGVITHNAAVSIHLVVDPNSYSSADLNARGFSFRVQGYERHNSRISIEHQGSFLPALGEAALNIRISTVQERYMRPHYSEDSANPGEYIEDEQGDYVRDEQDPRIYIRATEDPNGGYYAKYGGYLASNGIIIS